MDLPLLLGQDSLGGGANIRLTNDQSTLQTTTITLTGMTGKIIHGDGNLTLVTPAEQTYTIDYVATGTYSISIIGNLDSLTKLDFNGQSYLSADLEFLRLVPNLEYLDASSTGVYGDASSLAYIPLATHRDISGSAVSTYTSVEMPVPSNTTINISDLGLLQTEVDNFTIDCAGANLGSELSDNGDMESGFTGGLADDWTNIGGTPTQETTIVHSGNNSQKINLNSGTLLFRQSIAGVVGEVYRISDWVRSDEIMSVSAGDANGAPDYETKTLVADTWTYFSKSIKKTNTTIQPAVRVAVASSANVYIDSFSVKQITSYSAPVSLTLTMDGTNASRSSASDDAVIAIVDAGGGVTANGGAFGVALFSGTLDITKEYIIITYVPGDDFTNIGAVNVTGHIFTPTGTTPTNWTNGSEVRERL